MPADDAGTWRRLHPITIVRELLGVAWNIVVAVILLGALEGGPLDRIEVVVPLAFFVVAVGRYYSTRYQLTPEAVLWRRGIIFRRRLEVPRSRIQNVSAGADVVGRIFGLRTVTISTAGSEGEIELALVSSEEASFLLADLLGRSVPPGAPSETGNEAEAEAAPAGVEAPPPEAADRWAPPAGAPPGTAPAPVVAPPGPSRPPPPPSRRLVALSVRELAVYALSGGAVATVLVGIVTAVVLTVVTGDPQPLLIVVVTAAAPLLSTLDLLEFELTAEADRLRVRHGLLRTRDKWARRERVQVLSVDRPVVRAALGYETVSVATADATVGTDSDLSLCSPLAAHGAWPDLAGELLEPPALREADLHPISPRAELRRVLRLLGGLAVPSTVLVLVVALTAGRWPALLAAVVLVGLVVATARGLARRAQRFDGFALDEQHLLVRRGMVGSRLWLVRRAKVQSVVVTATPFQRRLHLASVLVDTANVRGGVLAVPDLPRDQARELAAELVQRADQVFLPDGV